MLAGEDPTVPLFQNKSHHLKCILCIDMFKSNVHHEGSGVFVSVKLEVFGQKSLD